MAAWGYVRVSTGEQADHGDGLGVQRAQVLATAARLEVGPVTIVEDAGVSGALADRPGLAEVMARLEPGDILIVPKMDRLARDLMLQEAILADIWRKGATVASAVEAETLLCMADDPDDPTRRFIRQVLGAVAEYERSLIRSRMVAGRRRKLANGGFGGGPVPYGWAAASTGLVPVWEEQATLTAMARLREQGAALSVIAQTMNVSGQLRRGVLWTHGSVNRALAGRARVDS